MSEISYYGPKDPGCIVTISPKPTALGRNYDAVAVPQGIALSPWKGKDWQVATWGAIAKRIDYALTDPAFRSDILAALERTAPKPAPEQVAALGVSRG